MRRRILWAGVLAFVSAFLGGLAAVRLVVPAMVDAQVSSILADRVEVVDESGIQRVRLASGPGVRSEATVYSAEGAPRVSINTGGPERGGGSEPETAGLYVYPPEGPAGGPAPPAIARLGVTRTGDVILALVDRQRQDRVLIRVDRDGNPSIELLDAAGNVTWSAP
jgi:hypothetical protein